MGCGNSVAFDKLVAHPQYREWNEKFSALMITPSEIRKFHKTFCKADLDGGGTISLLELLVIIDVERTPFTKRVFSIFDDDGSGEIDFGEFVLALWNYCTLSKVALAMFAFDLYDRDASGILENYDLESMMKDVYGKAYSSSHYAKQVTKDLKELESKGEVDLNRFLEFTRTHHSLLWPAFQMQLYLKKKMMGVRFWKAHSERRVKLSKNKYVKIKDLLVMNAKKQLLTYQQTPTTAIITPTHLALEHVGTKADRKRLKSRNEAGLIEDVKQVRDQDFVKNYLNNYSLEAATSAASAPAKVRSSMDLSSATSSVKSVQDVNNMSNSSLKAAAVNRRKSMTTAPLDILQTVSEDIEQREKLYDLEEEEANRPKKIFLKPASDPDSIVARKKETSVSGKYLASLGVEANVLQTFQNNTGSESGIAGLPLRSSAGDLKGKPSASTRRGSFSKESKEVDSVDPVAALLAPSSKITPSPYRGSKAPSLTASNLAEAAAAASAKVNSLSADDPKNNTTTAIMAANKERRGRRGSLL